MRESTSPIQTCLRRCKAAHAAQPVKPATEPSPATTAAQPEKVYAGKYKSVEELEKGYWNSAQEAKRIADENKQLKEILTAHQRVNPAERADARPDFAKELEDAAIPVEPLMNLIRETARQIVKTEVLEPIVRGSEARAAVMREFPDFTQREASLQAFLSANPAVDEKYQRMLKAGLEQEALEFVFMTSERLSTKPVADASGQEQAVARATAALSGTQVGGRGTEDTFSQRLKVANEAFLRGEITQQELAALAFQGLHPDMAKPN